MQSNRADDQRGLLRKEDLVLPDFLHLPSCETEPSLPTPEGPKDCKRIVHPDVKEWCTQPSSKPDFVKNNESATMKIGLSGSKLQATKQPVNSKPQATITSQKTCSVPFSAPLSPILPDATVWKSIELQTESIQTVEDENVADLTLVAEGDISSPNSTLMPLPSPSSPDKSTLTETKFPPPVSLTGNQEKPTYEKSKSGISRF